MRYVSIMDVDPRRLEIAVRHMCARSAFVVRGELREVVITAVWEMLDRRRPTAPHPDFTVDEWDDRNNRLRVIAGTVDLAVAQAAYSAAVERWPNAILTLRKGAWVISRYNLVNSQ